MINFYEEIKDIFWGYWLQPYRQSTLFIYLGVPNTEFSLKWPSAASLRWELSMINRWKHTYSSLFWDAKSAPSSRISWSCRLCSHLSPIYLLLLCLNHVVWFSDDQSQRFLFLQNTRKILTKLFRSNVFTNCCYILHLKNRYECM